MSEIYSIGITPGIPSELNKIKEILYNCTECSSSIEILNCQDDIIEFKCLNNHKRKMLIKEYINKMKVYNNKNINDDICIKHNKKYIIYCIDCNLNLCEECLKLRNHINHAKNHIIEIQPNKKELTIIKNIINYYNNKIDYLENKKLNKEHNLNNKIKEYKNKLNEKN